ncbi:MAG: CAP domain-containing protein [Chloroflexota bacterium]|nr:CAP domain-containing protein [Chloroflexota bacterium]
MRRLLLILGVILGLVFPAAAQDAASVLLPRINNLRASKGLPAYAPHASLTAAANSHARWMADTGEISHIQPDGSGPRARAVNAGFPSSWISENIYRGASALTAWEWWLQSPSHYAGLVSPNYDKIGIGSASGAKGNAYVLVFGNSTGRLAEGRAATGGGASAAGGGASYVLGLDEFGNIKHEVQPGQTIGHILLIYGYTWDDYPYLLELNGMSEADRLNMQPGSVILVPPKAGTFTPAPKATAEAVATAAPTSTAAKPPVTITATPTRATEAALEIRIAPIETASPRPPGNSRGSAAAASSGQLVILGLAILLQLGVIGGASLGLWRAYTIREQPHAGSASGD